MVFVSPTNRPHAMLLFTRCFIIFTCCFLTADLFSDHAIAAQWPKSATPVKTEQVKQQYLAPIDWTAAEVISLDDTRISAETSGKIKWLPKSGERIKKNQVVAQLDSTDIDLQISQLKSQINAAQTRLTFLKKETRRLEKLHDKNLISMARLETTLKDRDIAMANVETAQVKLGIQQQQKAKTRILAPFDGVVTQRFKQPYEWAKQGEALLQFTAIEQIEIRTYTPIHHLPALATGNTIEYKHRSMVFSGTITHIIAAGSKSSHQAEIRIKPTVNTGKTLTVGDILQVAIPTQTARNTLTVPRDALVIRKDGIKVYKINKDNSAAPVPITTGISNHRDIEVIGKLDVGDRVVTRGGERLRPGQTVKVLGVPTSPSSKITVTPNKKP